MLYNDDSITFRSEEWNISRGPICIGFKRTYSGSVWERWDQVGALPNRDLHLYCVLYHRQKHLSTWKNHSRHAKLICKYDEVLIATCKCMRRLWDCVIMWEILMKQLIWVAQQQVCADKILKMIRAGLHNTKPSDFCIVFASSAPKENLIHPFLPLPIIYRLTNTANKANTN